MKVLLLHAFPLDERMWEPQREALAGHDVVAPRLYGRGETMDAWAESILGDVSGDVVPVGASMGGYCALALARRAPERVRGVVLLGSRADEDAPERREGRAETIRLIRDEGVEALWEATRPKLFADDADPAVVERARTIALEQDVDELAAAVAAIRDRPDSSDVARSVPLVLAVGDSDPFVGRRDAEALAGANAHVLAGARHLVSMERPEEVNRILVHFLERAA
jgi:pimeloyl-ACP methyl ester carboxylesterase